MAKAPRVVIVTRPTDYQLLLARHATRGQSVFFLEQRGQNLEFLDDMHARQIRAIEEVRGAVPEKWRSTAISREDLDRFLFEPDDLVVAVGQDGLVANLAKYLDAQPVIGINPAVDRYPGILVQHEPAATADLLHSAVQHLVPVEHRTMVAATLEDGQQLVCLNEVFVGHASHQSARYTLQAAGQLERQSSSGVIVASGTGATGWARSIHLATGSQLQLPEPDAPSLAYFVREAWPSVATGNRIREGKVAADAVLTVTSEMDDRGVIFGDGIEHDCLPFSYGRTVTIRPADRTLNLVVSG